MRRFSAGRAACFLLNFAAAPLAGGASPEIHAYGGTAVEAFGGSPGALGGVGVRQGPWYLAAEGWRFDLDAGGRRWIREFAGLSRATASAYGLAAVGGVPVRVAGVELLPFGIAGYTVAKARGCVGEVCVAGRFTGLDYGGGAAYAFRFGEKGRRGLRAGVRITRHYGVALTVGYVLRLRGKRSACIQCGP